MSRPYKNLPEGVIRCLRANAMANLEVTNEFIGDLAERLEQADLSLQGMWPKERRPFFGTRDYLTLATVSTQDQRDILIEKIADYNYELEEREADIEDARDPSGGIAA